MWAIIKKEVKTYFLSPVGYVFIGAFLLMSSFFFYIYTYSMGSVEYSSLFYYTSELLTFTIALLTMGAFAAERKNGTETLLLTSSRSITGIVIGKFLAALVVIIITEIFSLMYYIILCIFAGEIVGITKTITTLLGFILLTMSYISFGLFISSLTENQIIAGVATIVLLIVSWFLPNLSEGLYILSPISLFQKFPEGIIGIKETIILLMQTGMFTILTIIALQRRKNLK